MIAVPITWVYVPPLRPPDAMSSGPERYAGLIAEIGRFAEVSIPMVQGPLWSVAPLQGIILMSGASHPVVAINECAPERRIDLARRLVPIDVGRTRVFEELLEPLSLPAAVDSMTHLEWEGADPNKPGARGPYGLREIGRLVGASCLLFESERYCYLHSPTHHGLPHLLADYLTAYANAVLVRC